MREPVAASNIILIIHVNILHVPTAADTPVACAKAGHSMPPAGRSHPHICTDCRAAATCRRARHSRKAKSPLLKGRPTASSEAAPARQKRPRRKPHLSTHADREPRQSRVQMG
jgi:hypothetical protein